MGGRSKQLGLPPRKLKSSGFNCRNTPRVRARQCLLRACTVVLHLARLERRPNLLGDDPICRFGRKPQVAPNNQPGTQRKLKRALAGRRSRNIHKATKVLIDPHSQESLLFPVCGACRQNTLCPPPQPKETLNMISG